MWTDLAKESGSSLTMMQANLPTKPLTGLTVLLVEDSRFSSEAIRLLCIRSGARMRRADCLSSARRHLQTYRPEIVIVDLGLPDGNGTDLIRDLTKAELRIPVVLGISGDPELGDNAICAGADGFIEKPVISLGVFQQTLMASLPAEMRSWKLSVVPDDIIRPDDISLRDDLTHAIAQLDSSDDMEKLDYITKFLAGVARISEDRSLENAAMDLAMKNAPGRDMTRDIAVLQALVESRLSGGFN